jgi:hypothetical protein
MSTHNYTREQNGSGEWNVPNRHRSKTFNEDLLETFPGKAIKWKADGNSVDVEMTPDLDGAEQAILDTLISDHKADELAYMKTKRAAEVDALTDELIKAGMSFGGKVFSLSPAAQLKMVAAYVTRNDPAFTFPVVWNTIDDLDTFSIDDAQDMSNFYLTGIGTVRAHLDSGTTIKDAIRAATTVAELDAVEDNR